MTLSYECDNDDHDIGCQCPGRPRVSYTLKQSLEDALWYGLDAEQDVPHSGVDMQIVVADVIKYLAHRGYVIVPKN